MKSPRLSFLLVTPAKGRPIVITARPAATPKTVSHVLARPIRTGPGAPYTPPPATPHSLATR